MMRPGWGAVALFATAIFGALQCGCSEPQGGEPAIVYAPYDGAAYPNKRPIVPSASGARAFVSNNGSDTLSVLDLPTATLLATVPVGRDPVTLDGPHHLALGSDGHVFVALSYPAPAFLPGPHSAHSSSRRAGYVLSLAPGDLRTLGEARVEPNPGEIVLSEDGVRLVVSHFDLQRAVDSKFSLEQRRGTLAVLDPKQVTAGESPQPRLIPVCLAPHGVALSRPDGARAFVACYGEDAIGVVDLAGPKPSVTLVPLGTASTPGMPTIGPYSAVLSPSGGLVAVGCTEARRTRFFDTLAGTVRAASVVTTGAPYFAAWSHDGARVFVPTQSPDVLVVADAETGETIASAPFDKSTCVRPHEVTLSKDASRLYVVCEGDHVSEGSVVVLNAVTLAVDAHVKVGVYPDRLVVEGAP